MLPKTFDAFFEDVDAKLATAADEAAAKEAARPAEEDFIKSAVKDASHLAASYRDALRKRSISADYDHSETGISFTLYYHNGAKRVLQMVKGLDGNFLEIWTDAPNNDGKSFRATDGKHYREGNYDDGVYAGKLQQLVNDHLFYAKFNKGVR